MVPVPAPKPVDPPAPYTGIYRDINGNPDPKGQYTVDNWQRARSEALQSLVVVGSGIPVEKVTFWTPDSSNWTNEIRDSDYLWAKQVANNNDGFAAHVSASQVDLGRLINASEFHYLWLSNKGVNILGEYVGQFK